jgi:hypothetical protein
MPECPSGHQSQTSDYCDTCGALMGGAAAASAAATSAGAATQGNTDTCPVCGAARGGRFCEECGYDYDLAALLPPGAVTAGPHEHQAPAPAPDPPGATAVLPPGNDAFDAEFAAAERAFAESGGASASVAAPPGPPAGQAGATQSPSAGTSGTGAAARTLALLATVDHEYYEAQVQRGEIIAAEFPFPKFPLERRFALDSGTVRIGRASASRGLAVEIDLTGPPLDPAVSHLHAQLQRDAQGSWTVVDLGSANGTRLNGSPDPLPPETEVPVKPGDRIHLGVWTTLTLEEA